MVNLRPRLPVALGWDKVLVGGHVDFEGRLSAGKADFTKPFVQSNLQFQ